MALFSYSIGASKSVAGIEVLKGFAFCHTHTNKMSIILDRAKPKT